MEHATLSAEDRQVRFAGWVGLVFNLALAGAKLAAGVVGHSQAVVADAVHSLSDAVTDVAIIAGVRYWSQPADDRHPHGHRRIETMVAAAIGGVLAAIAVGLGWEAIRGLGRPVSVPRGIALGAAVLSIVVKEWLFQWTRAVGRQADSTALIANAWHHRTDAMSSVPAAIAVGVAMLDPRLAVVDRIGALVVCFIILYAAWRIVAPAIAQLADAAAPEGDRQRIEQLALGVRGVMSAHALRTRQVGSKLAVDLHVEVDAGLSVAEGYRIGQEVRRELLEFGPGVADVLVQVEPYRRSDTTAIQN